MTWESTQTWGEEHYREPARVEGSQAPQYRSCQPLPNSITTAPSLPKCLILRRLLAGDLAEVTGLDALALRTKPEEPGLLFCTLGKKASAEGSEEKVGGTQGLEQTLGTNHFHPSHLCLLPLGPIPFLLGAPCRVSTGKWTPVCSGYNSWFHFTSAEFQGMWFPGFCQALGTPALAQMPAQALGIADARPLKKEELGGGWLSPWPRTARTP
ncbi:hypothetical protein AAY473_033031 [Plecturocebus cupreus]